MMDAVPQEAIGGRLVVDMGNNEDPELYRTMISLMSANRAWVMPSGELVVELYVASDGSGITENTKNTDLTTRIDTFQAGTWNVDRLDGKGAITNRVVSGALMWITDTVPDGVVSALYEAGMDSCKTDRDDCQKALDSLIEGRVARTPD